MKRYSFFLALAILVVSFGLANADGITVESTSGTWDDVGTTKIVPGAEVTYTLRYDNTTGPNIGGMTNGYVVTTDDPGGFGAISGASIAGVAYWEGFFDLVWAEGALDASTVRFGGSKMTSTGLPAGFNDLTFTVTVDGITEGYELCIDSTYYPPTGTWKWVGGNPEIPNWGGPYCYTAETPPCLPPIVNNLPGPTDLQEYHCDAFNYQFTMIPDANDGSPAVYPDDLEWVGASHGTVDAFGNWTYGAAVTETGTVTVTLTVGNGHCTADYDFDITVLNHTPVFVCPTELAMTTGSKDFEMNATDDDDCATLTYTAVAGPDLDGASFVGNVLTINEADAGDYVVDITVSDGVVTLTCEDVPVVVQAGSPYQVIIDCFGGPEGPVYQGQYVDIDVTLNAAVGELGGYDMLIAYDNSGLSFQYAEMGPEYMYGEEGGWEYFNYRTDMCSGGCPSGLIRVIAIAETNNGAAHPTYFGLPAPNVMFSLRFLVTNDRTFECRSLPLRFFWYDCADNTLSNKEGDILYMSEAIFDGYNPDPNSNGYMQIYDSLASKDDAFPTYFGAPLDCAYDDKGVAVNDVSFQNGCVFIACADEIDARGDINMNDMANEIADAVLYSRYFVYGMIVFDNDYIEGQIAASDVNNDGIALSVADLVYLVRIIVGDALPYPKLSPMATTIVNNAGVLSVKDAMGAAVVSVEGNVTPELLVDNMEMMFNYDAASNSTRILVYSMNQGATFEGSFINANGNVASVDLATYEGATVTAKLLPGDYQLSQNYPNPFNPTTKVAFAVPTASEVTLTIYNITGQKVAEFAGAYEAGNHIIEWDASSQASGIYFYKMNAGNFEMTKKMVLLK